MIFEGHQSLNLKLLTGKLSLINHSTNSNLSRLCGIQAQIALRAENSLRIRPWANLSFGRQNSPQTHLLLITESAIND